MRRTVMLLTLLALPSIALAQAPAAMHDPAQVRKAIDARNAEWMGLANKGDAKGFAAFYAPGATVIPPGSEPVTGTANIEKVFAGLLASGVKNLKFKTQSLDVNGNYAYELGLVVRRTGEGWQARRGEQQVPGHLEAGDGRCVAPERGRVLDALRARPLN